MLDNSFDHAPSADSSHEKTHTEATVDNSENQEVSIKFPIKKLSEVFDACMNTAQAQETMKVYLRVRPSSAGKGTSTIEIDSDTSIVTQAPESSKRAQYTKMERRQYVRVAVHTSALFCCEQLAFAASLL
jgi:hypothetical protein